MRVPRHDEPGPDGRLHALEFRALLLALGANDEPAKLQLIVTSRHPMLDGELVLLTQQARNPSDSSPVEESEASGNGEHWWAPQQFSVGRSTAGRSAVG